MLSCSIWFGKSDDVKNYTDSFSKFGQHFENDL